MDPAPAHLFAHIRALLPTLIPSERRVAEVCLLRPREVVEWPVGELAAAARTSRATVVRASQHLGFRGYQHLRLVLARDLGSIPSLASYEVAAGAPARAVVGSVFQATADLLVGSLGPLDLDAVDAAAGVLGRARRLLLVGNGGSAPPAQDAALRFAGIGRPVEAPQDAIAQHLTARMLGPSDACLLISSSGANELTLRAAEAAQAAGATAVGISSFSASPLSRCCDLMLVVGIADPGLRSDVLTSRVAQILLITALVQLVEGRIDRPGAAAVVYEVVNDALRDSPKARPGVDLR